MTVHKQWASSYKEALLLTGEFQVGLPGLGSGVKGCIAQNHIKAQLSRSGTLYGEYPLCIMLLTLA